MGFRKCKGCFYYLDACSQLEQGACLCRMEGAVPRKTGEVVASGDCRRMSDALVRAALFAAGFKGLPIFAGLVIGVLLGVSMLGVDKQGVLAALFVLFAIYVVLILVSQRYISRIDFGRAGRP